MTAPARPPAPAPVRLEELIAERESALAGFMDAHADELARCCLELARRFWRGGTLIAHGTGGAATDAAHVAVEFMHPVIVGKRALPALAPSGDPTRRSATAFPVGGEDIALGLVHGGRDPEVEEFLESARRRGALAVAMLGRDGPEPPSDMSFRVDSRDPSIVQEVHETAYHVLWELVHTFFEQPGLIADSCITCGDVAVPARVVELAGSTAQVEVEGRREEVAVDLVGDVSVGDSVLCHAGVAIERLDDERSGVPEGDLGETGFLYPFLDSAEGADRAPEGELDRVLADVRDSTLAKAAEVTALRRRIDVEAVAACGRAIGERLGRGGSLIAFGNGGSSTDAQDLAADCLARGRAAIALNNDVATTTAVGNDVGFESVFARQLISLGGPGDVAVAITTSGGSANVIAGLEEARRRGMLTVALAGYDGGRLAGLEWLDHLLVSPSDHIPRIQEGQATVYHLLCEALGGSEA